RVRRLATEVVAGFAVGRTLAPCAVLQQSQGKPVPISALMRGGLRRANEPHHAKELESVCKQLDALLVSVQDKSRTQQRAANRARLPGPAVSDSDLRVPLIAILAIFWLVGIGVIILASRPVVTIFFGALILIATGWTAFGLRRIRSSPPVKK